MTALLSIQDLNVAFRMGGGRMAEAVGRLQQRAENHPQQHRQQHVARNRGAALPPLVEEAQGESEHREVGEHE